MISQLEDNPLVEDSASPQQDASSEPPPAPQKRPREDEMQEPSSEKRASVEEPVQRGQPLGDYPEEATIEGPPGESPLTGGDEVREVDETYGALLYRVALLESKRRSSEWVQRLQVGLKVAEREALRGCMGRLRALLVELQGSRTRTAAALAESTATDAPCSSLQPSHCAGMLELYGDAERLARLASRSHWLKSKEPKRKGAVCPEGDSWKPPMPPVREQAWVSNQLPEEGRCRFGEVQRAMERVPPELLGPVAPVFSALGSKLQQVCEMHDALCVTRRDLQISVSDLMARWNYYSLWATERSLLVAEQKMGDNVSAQNPPTAEVQLLSQQQRLQKRLHQAEIGVATLLTSAAEMKLRKVSPVSLQNVMQRYEGLLKLRNGLHRELVLLRKLLRNKLSFVKSPAMEGDCLFLGTRVAEEGQSCLLQHSCAALWQRFGELNKRLVKEVLRGSMACPPSPEQEERLLQLQQKACVQHASIVVLIAENARLQQRTENLSSIQQLMTSGNREFVPVVGKLHSSAVGNPAKQTGPQESGVPADGELAGAEQGTEGAAKHAESCELDTLEDLLNIFTTGTEELVKSINTRLADLSTLYKEERQLQNDVAFLTRLTVAGERLLHGKVGVPLMTGYEDDITAPLEDACLLLQEPLSVLQQLPSLATLRDALKAQSADHAEQLLKEGRTAEEFRSQMIEDLEWCKQQCPRVASDQLLEARRELQQLKVSLETITKQVLDCAPLELEMSKAEEQLVQLERQMENLQEEVSLAEQKLQTLEDGEAVEEQEESCHEEEEEAGEAAGEDGKADAAEAEEAEREEETTDKGGGGADVEDGSDNEGETGQDNQQSGETAQAQNEFPLGS